MKDAETAAIDAEKVRELFALFRKQTPSSPDWFNIIDYCVGVLMEDYLKRLDLESALCVYDAHSNGTGGARAWCRTHGYDCPNLVPHGDR